MLNLSKKKWFIPSIKEIKTQELRDKIKLFARSGTCVGVNR